MTEKLVFPIIGTFIIWFGMFGILSIATNPNLTQNQIISRGFPYALVLIAGYGVFNRKDWARTMILFISAPGLALQIYEISAMPNQKDIIEALIFSFLILIFTNKRIKAKFNNHVIDAVDNGPRKEGRGNE